MQVGDIYVFYYSGSSMTFLVTRVTGKKFYYITKEGSSGLRNLDSYKRARLIAHYDTLWKGMKRLETLK